MRFGKIFDWGFASWYCLPTIVTAWDSRGGWLYLLWLKGRIGFRWSPFA